MQSIFFKLSAAYLIIITIMAVMIPLFPINPNQMNPALIGNPEPPSWQHWMGTDDYGRDIMLRAIVGARVSLAVGFIAVGISILIGISFGALSGFLGGIWDMWMMRTLDVLMALPTLFIILTIQVIVKPSIWNVMAVIGLTSWMGTARLIRAEVLSVKERVFVTAAKARGISEPKIILKHILPHTLNPVIVTAMLGMGSAILTESALSFLGLGVQPPFASWGNMLEKSLSYMFDAPWMALIPGILITLTVLSLNYLGDGLRAAINPKKN